MAISRRTGRSRLTLALLVLTSLAVLTLDFRDTGVVEGARRVAATVFSPFRGVARTVSSPFANAWNGVTDYGDLETENEELRAQLEELEGREVLGEDAIRQLDELLGQIGIPWVGDIPTAVAQVVAGPPSNFAHTVEINKGTTEGIREGMPVVNGAGLVGKVVQATASGATVQLITDPDFAVGVRLVEAGVPGTARGSGRGEPLVVDTGLESEAVVERGSALTTSGSDRSAFPAAIPVARVRSSRPADGGLTLDLVADPMVDTERLAFITVLLWEGTQ